ncbi:ABC transporter ATP-binding protein [Rhodobacteraceae bacterium CCMM004]|nr:ABC transporter ATP-binding protein [Rhodobacteraceae bacterium CCMM004]
MRDDRPPPALCIRDLTVRYDGVAAVDGIALNVPAGKVTALCGPNGCGKSSALKAIRRLVPCTGTVELWGDDLSRAPHRTLARRIAMLGQAPDAPKDMAVRDLVALGRYAHRAGFGRLGADDRAAIARAVAATQLDDLLDRPLGALSGGQLQRAWLAMVLAQDAPILFLDEPTNHLDISHALSTLGLVRRLADDQGLTVLVVLHDLNLAAGFADRIVFMKAGRIAGEGTVAEVFDADLISQVFDIPCTVMTRPKSGRPFVVTE